MLAGAFAGLAAGGVYAIIAVCLTLMSRLVRVVNFAQSAIGMLGAFSAVWLAEMGVPIAIATIVGLVLGTVLSMLLGLIVATWLGEATVNVRSAATVGALLMMISISFILFGTRPLPFTPIVNGAAFSVGGVVVSKVTIVLVILAVLVAVAAHVLLSRTVVGLRLRALSERPTTAELIGIPSKPLSVAVWGMTGFIATFVVVIVAPTQSNDATSLSLLIVPGAAAALFGGFKRMDLAVAGGLILGMLDGALAQTQSLVLLRDFLPFVIIVIVLLWLQRKEAWDAAR